MTTSFADPNVADPNVADLNVAEIEVAEIEVADVEVADVEVEVTAIEVAGAHGLRFKLHRVLDAAGVETMIAALENASADLRFVLLESSDGVFCEGLDLDSVLRGDSSIGAVQEVLERLALLFETMESTPALVVAAVDGPAMGGGLGLVAVADLVLATPRSRFALPETLMGLIPAVVFPVLTRRLSVADARLLALGRVPLCCEHALAKGLVDEQVDDPQLAVRRHLNRLMRMDAGALAAIKKLVADHFAACPEYRTQAIARFGELLSSRSTRERIRRFVEGDPPWEK